jgi:hypothetical protein
MNTRESQSSKQSILRDSESFQINTRESQYTTNSSPIVNQIIPRTSNFYVTSVDEAINSMSCSDSAIKILQLNIRGICDINKFHLLCAYIGRFKFPLDAIILSEVKLTSSHPIDVYSIVGYSQISCLRNDRKGGGIIVFLRSSLHVIESFTCSNQFEKIRATIETDNTKICLLAYYRAPGTDVKLFLEDLEKEFSSNNNKTILAGDLNINSRCLSVRHHPEDNLSCQYEELLSSYNFKVTNNMPTRLASMRNIDHLAVNFHDTREIQNVTIETDPAFTDHNMVLTSIKELGNSSRVQGKITKSRIIYEKLGRNFTNVSSQVLQCDNPDVILDIMVKEIQACTEKSSIWSTFRLKHKENIGQWTSEETLTLMREKDRALSKRRKKPSSSKIAERLQNVSKSLLISNRKDVARYIKWKFSSKDSKKMWNCLNSVLGRKKNCDPPLTINHNNVSSSNPDEISNIFNNFFSSCATDVLKTLESSGEPTVETSPLESMKLDPPGIQEIATIIKTMKNNSAPGHDGITPKVIKCLSKELLPLIHHLTSCIFETGLYPVGLKIATITPIFKSGNKSNVDDYRPISVLPILNKIVERIIHRRLQKFCCDHLNLLYSHQFGFRARSNTTVAALELCNMIQRGIDEKKIVSVVFMDLKKAFDIVDHEILLAILEMYGIRGKVLDILRSYLSNRLQMVKIGDSRSSLKPITAGVVQGSCLGPLLYLLFINAIGSLKIHGKLFLFADDSAMVTFHNREDEIQATVKEDMRKVIEFFTKRKILLNSSKTNFMLFTKRQANLPTSVQLTPDVTIFRVCSAKYLGLTINETLRWNDHIQNTTGKVASATGALWKLRRVLPFEAKKLIYNSLIETFFNYMSVIWGMSPATALSNIQVIQNRALRNVYNLDRCSNRVDMYTHKVENHLPIRAISFLNIATYMYQSTHGKILSNIIFEKSSQLGRKGLRNHDKLRPTKARTNCGKLSIETLGPKLFNAIPGSIKNAKHEHAFKWILKCHLRNEKFINSCFTSSFFSFNIS